MRSMLDETSNTMLKTVRSQERNKTARCILICATCVWVAWMILNRVVVPLLLPNTTTAHVTGGNTR